MFTPSVVATTGPINGEVSVHRGGGSKGRTLHMSGAGRLPPKNHYIVISQTHHIYRALSKPHQLQVVEPALSHRYG